jgi:hypothetical protein
MSFRQGFLLSLGLHWVLLRMHVKAVANIVRTKMGMEMDNAIIIGIAAGCCQGESVFLQCLGFG